MQYSSTGVVDLGFDRWEHFTMIPADFHEYVYSEPGSRGTGGLETTLNPSISAASLANLNLQTCSSISSFHLTAWLGAPS